MGKMSSHSSLVSDNYMSAAQMEYYLAYPDNQIVKTIGSPSDIKRYILTTLGMDEFKIGESAYYIESSRGSRSGMELGMTYYKTVEIAGRIYIHRMGKPVIRYTIYRFKELQVIPSI